MRHEILWLTLGLLSCADAGDRTEVVRRPPNAAGAGSVEAEPPSGSSAQPRPDVGPRAAVAPIVAESPPPADAGSALDGAADACFAACALAGPSDPGAGLVPENPLDPAIIFPAPWATFPEPASLLPGDCVTTSSGAFPPIEGERVIQSLGCGPANRAVVGAALLDGRKSVFARLDAGNFVRAYGLDANGDPLLGCVAIDRKAGDHGAFDNGGCEGAVGWMANLLNLVPNPPEPDSGSAAPPDVAGAPAVEAGPRAPIVPLPACDLGALRCEGSLIARCNIGTRRFELVRDCQQAATCARALASCSLAACSPDELGCALPELVPARAGVHGLSVGGQHVCALIGGGGVRCWGQNDYGQLGYGTSATQPRLGDDELPVVAGDVGVGGEVAQVVAGGRHSCALLTSGEVRCWGAGYNGRLGYANTAAIGDDEAPASAGSIDLGGPAMQLAAGTSFTCALLVGGGVRCWGSGSGGQLGLLTSSLAESVGDDETPSSRPYVDLGGPAALITAGSGHSCAILRSGEVRCWGRAHAGQLGYGNTNTIGDDETPASAGSVELGGPAIALGLGNAHSCAVLSDGGVRCWGSNLFSQLGHAADGQDIGDDEPPVVAPVLELGEPALQVAAGATHTCALLQSGAVRCWGGGRLGQLGNAASASSVPLSLSAPVELGDRAVSIDSSGDATCALLANQELRCWGHGSDGNLGQANTLNVGDDETPASVPTISVY